MSPSDLYLIPGPELSAPPIPIRPGERTVIGRELNCDLRISDAMVSRRHAEICWPPDSPDPVLIDLASQNGVRINGRPAAPNEPVRIRSGDHITVGDHLLMLRTEPDAPSAPPRVATLADEGDRPQTLFVRSDDSAQLAGRRLELLMSAAARMPDAENEHGIFGILAQALLDGSGFGRVLILRPSAEFKHFEIIERRDRYPNLLAHPSVSRTLLRAAAEGGPVRLRDQPAFEKAVSIAETVRSALCLPITSDESEPTFAYLDSNSPAADESDAVTFCTSIARLAALAISSLRRRQLETERAKRQRDLDAARRAQTALWPPETGVINGLPYRALLRPGTEVGGDALGLSALDDHRTLVIIGDVSGKGVGAGITANSLLAHAMAIATVEADPARIITLTNRFACRHTSDSAFMTMLIAIIDAHRRQVAYCDAGHGFLTIRDDEGVRILEDTRGGIPLGIDAGYEYGSAEFPLPGTARMILFSDGLVEQPDPNGVQFGTRRILELLQSCTDTDADIRTLREAIVHFAQRDLLADDVTILSIGPWQSAGDDPLRSDSAAG